MNDIKIEKQVDGRYLVCEWDAYGNVSRVERDFNTRWEASSKKKEWLAQRKKEMKGEGK